MKSSDYGKDYWENGVGSNYFNYADDPGWDKTLDVMDQYFGRPTVLYEVACAKGYFVVHARERGYDAQGCDISEYAISQVPYGTKAFCQVANATDLPWETFSADVVCAWEFLEHIPKENIQRVIFEMLRVLKPGGQIWLRICSPDQENATADSTHVSLFPRETWDQIFLEWGLVPLHDREENLDANFQDRDWAGRFFVYSDVKFAYA